MAHLKHPVFIFGILFSLALVTVGYWFLSTHTVQIMNFVPATHTTLTQIVSGTGQVETAENVDLGFDKPGRISRVYAGVGDTVEAGQTLVVLENGELVAQLDGARAGLASQQARLEELKRGLRPEELKLNQTKVTAATQAAEDSKNDLREAVKSSYIAADDAVRNKADQMFTSPRSSLPQLDFIVPSKQDLEQRRVTLEAILSAWQSSLQNIATGEPTPFAEHAKAYLQTVSDFLDQMSFAVNGLGANSQFTQPTIDGWKLAISTARSSISASAINIAALEEKLNLAISSATLAQNTLALAEAGASAEQIAAQVAAVSAAQAGMDTIAAQLGKTIIRAPIKGTVSRQDAKVGAVAAPNIPLVSLISTSQFQIKVNISEADVAKVKQNNEARVVLDAYGNNTEFVAKVVSVDPAATMIQGVANYRIVVQFVGTDDRIKPGMTANVKIVTEQKNTLAVPSAAIIQRGGEKFVLIETGDGKTQEQKIETGISGDNGFVEVLSGLKEGDRIASFGTKPRP